MLLALLLLAARLPDYTGYVVDAGRVLSPPQAQHLHDLSQRLDQSGIAQLAVATIGLADLGDESPEEYAVALFKKWGLGHSKQRSDGVLVLIVAGGPGHRTAKVEVGYGLEGVLNDGKVGAFIDRAAVPALRRNAFGEAAVALADALAGELDADAARGGDAAPGSVRSGSFYGMRSSPAGLLVTILAMGAVVVTLITSAARRSFPGRRTLAGAGGATAVSLVALGLASSAAGWIALIAGLIVIAVIWAAIAQHRCPKCASWMTIDEEIVDPPTYFSEGLKHVTQRCTNCSYVHEYDRAIPRKQVVVTSGGGGRGGGGGGDGFSGGGGGESGGGGASRTV
jgi:uncharacterized protein